MKLELFTGLLSLAFLARAAENDGRSDNAEIVNGKCLRLLQSSLKLGQMAPLNEDYMNGFSDAMVEHVKKVLRDVNLKGQEEQLAASIRLGVNSMSFTGSSGSSSPTLSEPTSGGNADSTKSSRRQQANKQAALKVSAEKKKFELPRPDSGMIYVSAANSKALFSRLIEDLDPSAIGLQTIPDTKVRYFTMQKSIDSISPKIIFFAPDLPGHDHLALGEALVAQRLAFHKLSTEVKETIKAFIVENQEKNAQFIFTGFGSGATVAQLAAIKLMFDADLQLYRNRHRVISIAFGDVRIFTPSFINLLGAIGFDHRDHLSFCSVEAFLPINVAMADKINYVGKRIEFNLATLQEKYEQIKPLDLNSVIVIQNPLVKYLGWETFKTQSLLAYENYETTLLEDKKVHVPKAIEALQKHFREYRLKDFPHIIVDCVLDEHGEELDKAIPSSRLICNIKDVNTKAEIQFFFNLFWTDDEHDINEKFHVSLREARKEANEYVRKAKVTDVKGKKDGLKIKKVGPAYRDKFINWALFFQAQKSDSVTPNEAASLLINPFFEDSIYFELENKKFKYSLVLSSEVLMRKLLSTEANDQKLIKILFGPTDSKLMYRDLPHACQLFRAPVSALSETTASLANLITDMFNTQVPNPIISQFVAIEKTKTWGDFKLTSIDSAHMDRFTSGVELKSLVELFAQPSKSKDCSYSLPAKHCPRMTLLELESPFWSRMYNIGDLFVAFRGSGLGYAVQTSIRKFCEGFVGREYEKIGSAIVFEIQSQVKSYGKSMIPQYTFYMMVIQDPKRSQ